MAWAGGVILAFGVLVLLFVAYQLWGTSITAQLHQDALRTQFNHELATLRAQQKGARATGALPLDTTTTTQALRGFAPITPGVAPTEGQPIGIIDIPEISADYVVVQGTGTADLELGPGHYMNTPLPGQPGNAAIAGHRTTYLHPFYNLNELAQGDPIYVTTTQGRFQYDVATIQAVAPTDLAVLDPTTAPTLTLTTCNPRFSAAQRLVVQATMVSTPAPIATVNHPIDGAEHVSQGTTHSQTQLAGQSGGSPWLAVGWGVAVAVVVGGIWFLLRRRQHWYGRLSVAAVGLIPVLALLFFFFQSLSPLLPASF